MSLEYDACLIIYNFFSFTSGINTAVNSGILQGLYDQNTGVDKNVLRSKSGNLFFYNVFLVKLF